MAEKHYAPWVRERQDQMDTIIAAALSKDPLCQREALREVNLGIEN